MVDESVEKKINLLRRVELFSTLTPDELEIVAYHSQLFRYRSGSLIFMEGSPGNELYVIKEGEVLITRRRGGDEVDIAQFIAGESFGEWDLFGDTPRTVTAKATKDSILLVYPREGMNFHMFLQKYPKMSARMIYKLLAIIAQRIRTTHQLINEKTPWVRNLKKQMLLDKLTGLHNKNFLMEECGGLLRGDSPSALLIIKPDNFKEINDRFGHEAGDKLLILMSIFIMSALRESDLAIRYGGDEFAVLLPDTARDEAIALARDLGVVLHGMELEQLTGASRVKITVSIGIAIYPQHGADALTLAEGAREKMFRARAKGGNRIVARN